MTRVGMGAVSLVLLVWCEQELFVLIARAWGDVSQCIQDGF